jgi:FkbM family methyltransferase
VGSRLRHRFAMPLHGARAVSRPWAFAGREIAGRRGVATYRLRESGLSVLVRHPFVDIWVFDEIFHRRMYEPPAPVREMLGRLDRPIRVLDLGGNVGLASAYLLSRFPGARVTALEPDRANADVLRRAVAVNGLADRWEVVEACAAPAEGSVPFEATQGPLSRMLAGDGNDSVERVAARDVFPLFESADLVKMDIEGGEWAILADPRFSSVPCRALVLEYHPHLGPPDPEGMVRRRLAEAGFEVGKTVEARPDQGEGLIWAWRPD